MRDRVLERTQLVAKPRDDVFAFFADPRNLEAITPPWLRFRIDEAPARLEQGSLLRYRLHLHGVPIRWLTRMETWTPPGSFTDRQLRGPYLVWVHTHRFTACAAGTEVYDHVRYRIPGGRLAPSWRVERWLWEIFEYRRGALERLLG
jgi:ligand-binding SRPBCC domain-containing protein